MNIVDKALETQLRNIQTRTGKTLDELYAMARNSDLAKHGQLRDLWKRELDLGHGDANTLASFYLKSRDQIAGGTAADDPADAIYAGAKAALRPIHDQVMAAVTGFGPFEVAPKKSYLSLRRKKQFAMVGPATKSQVEVGLNMKGLKGTARLVEMPAGGMCQYTVRLSKSGDVDSELIGWIRQAWENAG